MSFSLEDVKQIKKEFQKEYWSTEPFEEYITACGISQVSVYDGNAPANELDDWCISVGLLDSLPQGISLPTEYKGVRIFTKVIGEIRPL